MAFIETVALQDATGEVRELYEANQADWGYVPNYVKVHSLRPGVLKRWGALLGEIRSNMDGRRYELVTLATARALRNSYCMLAHSSRLMSQHGASEAETAAICGDFRTAGLGDADVAVMDFAEKVAGDASQITQGDVDALRAAGLSDADIFDVAAAAAARCYFTKLNDALGAEPDAAFTELSEGLRLTLVVGRPISAEPVERI